MQLPNLVLLLVLARRWQLQWFQPSGFHLWQESPASRSPKPMMMRPLVLELHVPRGHCLRH